MLNITESPFPRRNPNYKGRYYILREDAYLRGNESFENFITGRIIVPKKTYDARGVFKRWNYVGEGCQLNKSVRFESRSLEGSKLIDHLAKLHSGRFEYIGDDGFEHFFGEIPMWMRRDVDIRTDHDRKAVNFKIWIDGAEIYGCAMRIKEWEEGEGL